MKADPFGDRMKSYEAVSDIRLPVRLPVLLRLDGNSFSKLTAGGYFTKPFDPKFTAAMDAAAKAALRYTHGCFAYVQSDEITILLRNDRAPDDSPILGNRVQKLCSLVAATCSVAFYRGLREVLTEAELPGVTPVFDCRVFVVPHADVHNAFMWRQFDAWKNCVGGVAYYGLRNKYGTKEAQNRLLNKSTKERQELIFSELGINMNDFDPSYKRGRIVVKEARELLAKEAIPPDRLVGLRAKGVEIPERVTRHFYEVRPAPDLRFDKDFVTSFLG
jgi:tRNA(His) guanylyltransferase